MNAIKNSKGLYWGLISTFTILYLCVGFVSTLHSITFFQLANSLWLATLLGITYEIGQATVLFSILMTKNKSKIMPWSLMILLTALQVTANVYASFKFMDEGGNDWTYWQRSILFWLEVDGPEMFKVVISWISGALLPIIALGMTSLVADMIGTEEEEYVEDDDHYDEESEDLPLIDVSSNLPIVNNSDNLESLVNVDDTSVSEVFKKPEILPKEVKKTPIKKARGWHLKREYRDENGDLYSFGNYIPSGVVPEEKQKKA